ncbi:hypothetical protein P691DRAFT_724278 [Macrolepiota fuliginosa MF-IS2]|uniref:CFEM domain-containing protein n=1 Tax=Macrolepiota fuliginosa MF-IS2 TaxID=1400762 RepID=A0A9P6C7M6_9AGAR|nr:hypothetical protein P691DRAFT_724278 [Macrolepiota fuliginosa MF-IS2]
MQFMLFSLAVIFALTGQALAAFNVTLGTKVFFQQDLLNITGSAIPPSCASNCYNARNNIQSCGSADTACLCKTDTVDSVRGCQQCMFTQLIDQNIKPQDPRVGSTPFMAGYSTACGDANHTLTANQTALKVLSKSWDGPFDAVLPVGGTVVAVMAGAFLGISALLLLSNLS